MRRPLVLCALAAATLAAAGSATPSRNADEVVVVPRGRPIQIAVVLDRSTQVGAPFTPSIRSAIQMTIQLGPRIHRFAVQVNDQYDGPCGSDPGVVAANAAAAAAVVANPQNVALIGHMCSYPFAGCPDPPPTTALWIYQDAGVVAINGSTTAGCLPSVGPTVFDRTAVADPDFDAWYAAVQTLPSDRLWREAYQQEFDAPPSEFADLYFDATRLLLTRLAQVSHVAAGGNLVVDRAALALAVRRTTDFSGVTGPVTLDPQTGNRVP
jgi:hypothetical protein